MRENTDINFLIDKKSHLVYGVMLQARQFQKLRGREIVTRAGKITTVCIMYCTV